jgi:hypothetical protein
VFPSQVLREVATPPFVIPTEAKEPALSEAEGDPLFYRVSEHQENAGIILAA